MQIFEAHVSVLFLVQSDHLSSVFPIYILFGMDWEQG